jgi:hypothetical protein
MLKTVQVDFVCFQFRCRCTDPSDLSAKLFRKNRPLGFDHCHFIIPDRTFSKLWSTTCNFSMLKTGQVDFVWFQFRCHCTDPSDYSAKLFRKKRPSMFNHFHSFRADRNLSKLCSTTCVFFMLKAGQVDFVWFQFRCRCTDHSNFNAKLLIKNRPSMFEHSHI